MEAWLGGSDEPRARGRSLDTSCSWKCRGSTSILQRIINRHTMLWTFKSLCVSVTKDADPFAHPLVPQHPARNSLPSLPHPFARWVMGCWARSPKAPDVAVFKGLAGSSGCRSPWGLPASWRTEQTCSCICGSFTKRRREPQPVLGLLQGRAAGMGLSCRSTFLEARCLRRSDAGREHLPAAHHGDRESSWVFPHLLGCVKAPPGREGEISASGVQPGIKRQRFQLSDLTQAMSSPVVSISRSCQEW